MRASDAVPPDTGERLEKQILSSVYRSTSAEGELSAVRLGNLTKSYLSRGESNLT
jgi:hypothetical protein